MGAAAVIPIRHATHELRLTPPRPLPDSPPAGQQARPWISYDRIQAHPGTGLKPERVWQIFRAAEQGWVSAQCDLFDDIVESDGHLRSLIEGRITNVAGKEWVIQPGGVDDASRAAADALQVALADDLDFVEFMEHQLSATYYGFAASEIDWQPRGGVVIPARFVDVPHRRFFIGDDNDLRLLTEGDRSRGVELAAGTWVVSRRRHSNLARAGLLRTATWWALFKRLSVRDWVVFAEKFGIPHVTGRYQESASPEALKALEEAVEDIGEGGQAILADTTEIVIEATAQRGGDPKSVHPALISMCEAQMSKLINGATQNVETGTAGSYAQANVHQERAYSLGAADAARLGHTFRRHVSVPFVRFNGYAEAGAKPPKLKIRVVRDLDPEALARVAAMVVNELGADIDAAPVLDELGFRQPANAEDAFPGAHSVGASSSASSAPEGEDE